MSTKLDLCSRALVMLGCAGISSFEEPTAEALVAGSLYEATKNALTSYYPWSFSTGDVSLPRLSASPVADFKHAYELPKDRLRVVSVGSGGSAAGVAYRIMENRLYADVSPVVMRYIFTVPEDAFPAYFEFLLMRRLAAEFCLPLTESAPKTADMFKLFEVEFSRAKLADAQSQTPRSVPVNSLISARC